MADKKKQQAPAGKGESTETCDLLVRLPMKGAVESLNVSVAAAPWATPWALAGYVLLVGGGVVVVLIALVCVAIALLSLAFAGAALSAPAAPGLSRRAAWAARRWPG